jgi:hypothetical protein
MHGNACDPCTPKRRMDVTIEKPIFIVGNIRSGTTILYDLAAVHPDVCWFSNYSNRFPKNAYIPLTHRLLDMPLVGRGIKHRIARNNRPKIGVPWPDEGDDIYHGHAGFGAVRDGVETTLSADMERKLKDKIIQHLRFSGKDRFLSKETANNRRIELLNKMFPDAFFVHLIRDGRAVAASTLKVSWWNDTHIWWLGYTAAEWERRGKAPIELAGLYWRRTVEEIRRQKAPATWSYGTRNWWRTHGRPYSLWRISWGCESQKSSRTCCPRSSRVGTTNGRNSWPTSRKRFCSKRWGSF